MKLLLVEDSPDNADLLVMVFEGAGHEVMLVNTGAEGVALAASTTFDAILTDISLPGDVDGLDLARAVRCGGPNRSTAIVAVTAFASTDVHDKVLAAGCDRVVTKPIVDLPAFVAAIEGIVSAR